MLSFLAESASAASLTLAAVLGIVPLYYLLRSLWKRPDRDVVYGLPLIGVLLEWTPLKSMDTLLKYSLAHSRVFDMFLLSRRITVLNNAQDAREVLLKRPKAFRRNENAVNALKYLGLGHGVLVAEGDAWSRQRRVVAPPLSKKNVSSMVDAIGAEVDGLADQIALSVGSEVDLVELCTYFTICVIGKVGFGFSENDGSYFYSRAFQQDIRAMLQYVPERLSLPVPSFIWRWTSRYRFEVDALAASKRIFEYGRNLVAKKDRAGISRHLGNSLLQHLLDAGAESKLSADEVIGNIVTIFIAGTDTTSIGLCWTLMYLSQHEHILQEVLREAQAAELLEPSRRLEALRLTRACFTEAIRLRGPVDSIAAQVADDAPLTLASGLVVRPSDLLFVPIDALKRDPSVFANPDCFQPHRWLTSDENLLASMRNSYLAFGSGPRVCPGMDLSMAEGAFVISRLVRSFTFRLNCNTEDIVRRNSMTVSIDRMPFVFETRVSDSII